MHAKGIADTFFFTLGFQGNLRNIFRTKYSRFGKFIRFSDFLKIMLYRVPR